MKDSDCFIAIIIGILAFCFCFTVYISYSPADSSVELKALQDRVSALEHNRGHL